MVARDQTEGLLPISSPRLRHSRWCRDMDGMQACTARRLRTQQRTHDMESWPLGRDTKFCVATRLRLDQVGPRSRHHFHVAAWFCLEGVVMWF